MTTKKLLFLSIILLPVLTFGKNEYGINEKKDDAKSQIKLLNDFQVKPFDQDLQLKILEEYRENIRYGENKHLYNILKLLHINTTNFVYKKEAEKMLHEYPDNSSAELAKKISSAFTKTKKESENSMIQVLYLHSMGEKEEAEALYRNKKSKGRLSLTNLFYNLKYLVNAGKEDEARDIFFKNIDGKKLKKRGDQSKIRIKKGSELITTKIYALAAVFEKKEKKKRILSILGNLENGTALYLYYAYKKNKEEERYKDASVYIEELIKVYPQISLKRELINLYKKDSFGQLINKNQKNSWISARKGLKLIEEEKNLGNIKQEGISLKRNLLRASSHLVYELSEKGEYSQAKRVQMETSKLMAIKLF